VTPIRAVLLDVGGIFHLPDHVRIMDALARAGVSARRDDLDRAHYAGVAALDHFAEGDRSVWHAYVHAYARSCGSPDDAVESVAEVLLSEFTVGGVWTRIVPGSAQALRSIAELDVALAVVSNADGTVEQQLRNDGICQVGPGPGVDVVAVLDSSVVGFSKPDPRIFQLALDRVGVDASDAIHVGDTPAADVAGARAAGVRPVLIDPYDDHQYLDVERVHSLAEVAALIAEACPAG
jgi:putative hydrolase of the HAD superfamily